MVIVRIAVGWGCSSTLTTYEPYLGGAVAEWVDKWSKRARPSCSYAGGKCMSHSTMAKSHAANDGLVSIPNTRVQVVKAAKMLTKREF